MNSSSKPLISVIIPAYNCEDYLAQSLESVLNQSYSNWEVCIVDDCSTDRTLDIIQMFAKQNPRIRFQQLETNSGAAMARNRAVEMAEGEYLAFLDSDDLWYPKKLERQLAFMIENSFPFTCTNYSKIDELSNDLNRVIYAKPLSDYWKLLKKCPGNSTVMYHVPSVGKQFIPNIRKRNDYVMWLQVIKQVEYVHGLNLVLSSHRVRSDSLSAKKSNLIGYHWFVYRNIEKLSLVTSSYLIVYWIIATILRNIKSRIRK